MTRFDRRAPLVVIGAGLLGTLAGPAAAQIVQIDELRTLRSDAIVEIEVVTHAVVVEGWDRNEIEIVGEYDSDFDEMEISGDQQSFRFEIDQDDRRSRGGRAGSFRLEIRVPRGVSLSVETVSGYLGVSGLTESLTGSSVSGGVDVAGDLATVTLSSVSGAVGYVGDAPEVRLESVSGGVEFRGRSRDVRMESVSGSVFAEGGAETIEAESVSGTIQIVFGSEVRVADLDASSVSGGLRFRGSLTQNARVEVESHSGSVELSLGPNTDAEFELESFSGSVSADLPGMRDEVSSRRRVPPNRSLRFVTGWGSGRVRASSFSGSVRIEGG